MKRNISKELPKLAIAEGPLSTIKTGALVVGIFSNGDGLSQEVKMLDTALNGKIKRLIVSGDFKGRPKETLTIYLDDQTPDGEAADTGPERIILAGLGKREEIDLDTIRAVSAAAAKAAKSIGVKKIALPFDLAAGCKIEGADDARISGDVFIGAALGTYDYTAIKGKKKLLKIIKDDHHEEKKEHIDEITVVNYRMDKANGSEIEEGATAGMIISDSVYLARDLINAPPNLMTPRLLARTAKEVAFRYQLICDVFKADDIKKMKMGAFLSVARGSKEPPALITIEYVPKEKAAKNVALVGKGITFDSGGLSLKSAEGMTDMKTDMSGAAVVLTTVMAAARLKLKTGVVGILPATENMPGSNATKPGDVVTAMDETTIEILNTDAEGRLILADAITYAKKYEPTAIIDIATLTSAVVIALGKKVAAIYSTDDALLERLKAASAASGEKLWPMPLYKHYEEQLKSDIADIKNSGGREAGSITAATFLKHFAGDYHPWAHIDIAGTARAEKEYDWIANGGTGFGVMLLLRFLEMMGE
ncbi:MAG: leucyl aminopeptidase [Deltaproteobacteria bacterium]|uniref:Probable cytosol aminopeptidase n=1 Tax=Candidatus Zymogenus saltonus TaxID=2844893 RepID=A0A9D8PP85_9DELT|nr:leucyl aminopeptidase [Candidatus Zymogenus saltonus]